MKEGFLDWVGQEQSRQLRRDTPLFQKPNTTTLSRVFPDTMQKMLADGEAQETSDGKYVLVTDALGAGVFVDILFEFVNGYYAAVKTWTQDISFLNASPSEVLEQVTARRAETHYYTKKHPQRYNLTVGDKTIPADPQLSRADYLAFHYEKELAENEAAVRAERVKLAARFTAGLIPVVGTATLLVDVANSKEGFNAQNGWAIALSVVGDLALFASAGLSKAVQSGATVSRSFTIAAKTTIAVDAALQGVAGIYDIYQASQAENAYDGAGYIGSALLRLFGATTSMMQAARITIPAKPPNNHVLPAAHPRADRLPHGLPDLDAPSSVLDDAAHSAADYQRLKDALAARHVGPLGPANGLEDLARLRKQIGPIPSRNAPDGGTLSRLDVDGRSFYGVSAHAQKDMALQGINPISIHHAEADAFNQALKAGAHGGKGKLFVDNKLCNPCSEAAGVRRMMEQLGLDQLEVITPNGTQLITR